MVNKENVQKWVEALRSGEYKQVRQTLGNNQGYCCLGVACEVALKNGVKLTKEQQRSGNYFYDGAEGILPAKVGEWLGLGITDYNPSLGEGYSATYWNDSLRRDFNQIADSIEAKYLKGEEKVSV